VSVPAGASLEARAGGASIGPCEGTWYAALLQTLPQPFSWLNDADTAMLCCVMPMVWAGMGPGCLIYLAALKGIPEDYREAASFEVLGPPAEPNERLASLWREFLEGNELPFYAWTLAYTGAPVSRTIPRELREYQGFPQRRFGGDLARPNRELGTESVTWNSLYISGQDCTLRRALPMTEPYALAFREFRQHRPLESRSPDTLFCEWLQARYPTVAAATAALGTAFARFDEVVPPHEHFHWLEFQKARGHLRQEFLTRNYRAVLECMLFHGRGIANTVLYCVLAVALALIVNPTAAYAMSRYRMPTTYKVLLFLLLTMAFPPMVTQIPVFLMLRQLGLLNTFAALLLPGLANGYSIFLLKGSFGSLGQELYESAQIDGAGEWVMFWHITMALSKPILAVIALSAFTGAYANFMFALLICQDPRMWTLMVWLYRLNGGSGAGVIYASLIIAAIPTLLVFVFCQNIIMRGIVVPVEK